MMATLLIWRGRIRHFFEKHYLILRGLIKAIVILVSLMLLTSRFPEGFFSGKFWLFPVIAGVCAFVPDALGILAIMAVVEIEVWQISHVLAITILLLIAIFFLLFGRKAREQWYIMLSVPTLSVCHMGFSVPMVAALFVGPSMIPALVMGIILRFSLEGVAEYTATAQRMAGDSNFLAPLQYLVDYLISNRSFLVALIVYTLTFLVIYFLRRANFRHAPQIAILVGAIVLYTLEMISNIIWELELDLLLTLVLVIVTMGIAYVFQFMHISLDYHGTRRLQFEDDEYYYYVTAIPKYNVAVGDKVITKILPEELAEERADLKEEVEKVLAEERGETRPEPPKPEPVKPEPVKQDTTKLEPQKRDSKKKESRKEDKPEPEEEEKDTEKSAEKDKPKDTEKPKDEDKSDKPEEPEKPDEKAGEEEAPKPDTNRNNNNRNNNNRRNNNRRNRNRRNNNNRNNAGQGDKKPPEKDDASEKKSDQPDDKQESKKDDKPETKQDDKQDNK